MKSRIDALKELLTITDYICWNSDKYIVLYLFTFTKGKAVKWFLYQAGDYIRLVVLKYTLFVEIQFLFFYILVLN